MKETELRIGNIYMSTKFNTPVYLTAEDIAQMVYEADGAKIEPLDVVEPIDLTVEWIEKLGFKNCGDKYTWCVGSFIVYKRKRGFVLKKNLPTIKYVHQLQNIYYSLTGKELCKFTYGVWKQVRV